MKRDFKNFFSFSSDSSLGLDIGDRSLKFALLDRSKGGIFIKKASVLELIEGTVERGRVVAPQRLSQAIRKLLKKHNLKNGYGAACLPEESSFVRVITLPGKPREDMEKAVTREAQANIPVSLKDVYLSWQEIPSSTPQGREVQIAASPKKIVDSYLQVLKDSGLKPSSLEVESFAILRALINRQDYNQGILILDLGATKTSLIIFAHWGIRFTTTISVSDQDFNQYIKKRLKVSGPQAERIKRKYGIKKEEVKKAVNPVLEKMVSEIRQYVEFYNERADHILKRQIKKMVLTGGGANLAGLALFLSRAFKMPVEIGDPRVKLSPSRTKSALRLSKRQASMMTTAIGLALGDFERNET